MAAYRRKKTAAELRRKPPPGAPGYKPPRKKPYDYEGEEQKALINWLYGEKMRNSAIGELYDTIYHVPNGGLRNIKTAGDMKKQGVKAGVSDLQAMSARGGWYGLCLEFKATPPKDAALSDTQESWLALAHQQGYCAALARGLMEAKAVIREYAEWASTDAHEGPRKTLESGSDWRS